MAYDKFEILKEARFAGFTPDGKYFFFETNAAANDKLSIVCGGYEKCGPAFDIQRTNYPFHVIKYTIRGKGLLRIHGKEHRLESGMLAVVFDHTTDDLLRPLVRVVYDTKNERMLIPYVIDLSKPSGKGGADRIVGYESPEEWNIQPDVYL